MGKSFTNYNKIFSADEAKIENLGGYPKGNASLSKKLFNN
jgi:hypothetical protein